VRFDFLYKCCPKRFSFEEDVSDIWLKVYIGGHIKYPLFLSDFIEIWVFLTDFRKMFNYQISWKSVQWKLSFSMQTDGWTDRETGRHDEANIVFSQLCKHPWKGAGIEKDNNYIIICITQNCQQSPSGFTPDMWAPPKTDFL